MLTDEEKKRIREEEIYRQEVRQSLDQIAPKSRRQRVLAFLNTGVGLWLLSSVLIGSVTFFYKKADEAYAERTRKRATAEKLDTEIASRLQDLHKNIRDDLAKLPNSSGNERLEFAQDLVKRVYDYLNYSPGRPLLYSQVSVYPEFKEKTIVALTWDLEDVVSDSRKDDIKRARTAIQRLNDSATLYNKREGDRYNSNGPTKIFDTDAELEEFVGQVNQTLQGNVLPKEWASI